LVAAGFATEPAGAFVWPSAPAKVERALKSSDVAERRAASMQLGEMDEKTAAPLLRKALADPDVDVRLRAAKSAIRLRSPAALDVVIPWLSDPDVKVRLAACELIRYVPSAKAIVALGRVLGDPDAGVRLAAAAAMGASGAPEAVGPLLGHLDDPSASVRAEVAQALARIGDTTAAVPLIGKVGDSAPEVRRAVARALGELGDARATSALILRLQDTPQVKVEALGALGRLVSKDAVVAIAPLLDERASPEVRVAAVAALGKIGSEAAVRTLIKSLGSEDAAAKSSAVRDALEASGSKAVGPLVAALEQHGNPQVAAGAALVLGSMKAQGAGPIIVDAIRKGSLGAYYGLRALADLGDPATVPTVLEFLSDSNTVVRRQAVATVAVLMDPARHDGRAVEPLVAAMHAAKTSEDREQLARTLGRTGSPRAIPELRALLKVSDLALRLAAIDALGEIGPAGQEAELVNALGDDSPSVRLHAALAVAKAGGEASIPRLVDRLTQAATEDRMAIGIALAGALSRSGEAAAKQIESVLFASGGGVRDALIEALGRMPGKVSGALLAELARRSPEAADRRKLAEALGGHPEQDALLATLFADPDPGVRADAAWAAASLPPAQGASQFPRVVALMADADLDVAANATGAVALLAKSLASSSGGPETKSRAVASLCKALQDFRSYVRANALAGLGVLGARCEKGTPERRILAEDPSEVARQAAARLLSRAPSGGTVATEDARALSRCAADDKSGMVATSCSSSFEMPASTLAELVFVVPDGKSSPLPLSSYSLQRSDGLIRSGKADRRGAIFERTAPTGELRLLVPGALAL
jgi:HEAT repeat protein